jgi:hypothetical protein
MRGTVALPDVVAHKLAALDQIEASFEASFHFAQEVQGLRRFATLPISSTVQYLEALVVCDVKDRLLSVPHAVERYEGRTCLALLQRWQTGASADVVAFLQRKLDALPLAGITRQIEAARADTRAAALTARLEHGRLVLLNRGFNLLAALQPLCTLPTEEVAAQARAACEHSGYTPAQIAEYLRALDGPLYAPLRHPALSQRNMLLMDRVGVHTMTESTASPQVHDRPVAPLPGVTQPYAERVIPGYVTLTALRHNNPAGAGE